jgi:hypothetical protein
MKVTEVDMATKKSVVDLQRATVKHLFEVACAEARLNEHGAAARQALLELRDRMGAEQLREWCENNLPYPKKLIARVIKVGRGR